MRECVDFFPSHFFIWCHLSDAHFASTFKIITQTRTNRTKQNIESMCSEKLWPDNIFGPNSRIYVCIVISGFDVVHFINEIIRSPHRNTKFSFVLFVSLAQFSHRRQGEPGTLHCRPIATPNQNCMQCIFSMSRANGRNAACDRKMHSTFIQQRQRPTEKTHTHIAHTFHSAHAAKKQWNV